MTIRSSIQSIAILLFLLSLGQMGWAQLSPYVSAADTSLTFDDIEILNFDDNAGGAYSKPMGEAAENFFENDRRFHAEKSNLPSPPLAELEENTKDLTADVALHPRRAYLKTQIVKGPKGLRLRTVFFTGKTVLPLLILERNEEHVFDTESVVHIYQEELVHLLNDLPYQARVLSRRQNQVTVNAGAIQGLKVGQEILVIQVIQIERHPVLKFATQFQREIMGKVRLTKVDESISFGDIIFEKTASLISPDFKVAFHDDVNYESPETKANRSNFLQRTPTIGEAELLAGFGRVGLQDRLVTSGSVSGQDSVAPTVYARGELWITQNWFTEVSLQEYIAKMSNDLSGSTPSSLSAQVLRANFVAGYHFLMADDFSGPRFTVGLGYSKTKLSIADSSPTAFTSLDYSSLALVFGGKMPIDLESGRRFYLGADFSYHLNVGLSESPTSSGGSSSSKIATFDVFGNYPLKENVSLTGMVQFDQFSTNFSGVGSRAEPATSASLNFLTVLGGVLFQF